MALSVSHEVREKAAVGNPKMCDSYFVNALDIMLARTNRNDIYIYQSVVIGYSLSFYNHYTYQDIVRGKSQPAVNIKFKTKKVCR